MEDLKPCPFCGEPGHVVPRFREQVWQVFCAECDCELECHYESEDQAIAAWNTRASQWREILGSDGAYTGDEILAWGDKLGIKQVYYSDKDHLAHPWCIDDTGVRYVFGAFTKWQPLPQPPVSK